MSLRLESTQLRDHAYYRTGGTADVVFAPRCLEELAVAAKEIHLSGAPVLLLGGGTNSLVMDEHFKGAVILFKDMTRLDVQGDKIIAGSGVENSHFARTMLGHGLAGAGWMNGLPGQLGGTIRMNARCYGGEISQIVTRVTTVTPKGEIRVHSDKSMFKGYKDTIFMTNGELVAEAEIGLARGDPGQIKAKMDACIGDRKAKGQYDYPSCGCVFKNDYAVGVSSGILLDQAGAKALKVGGAEVSPYHANFVYNKGATSRDILELTLLMRELVYAKFGVWLAYEMEILGVVPQDLAAKIAEVRVTAIDEALVAPLRARMGAAT